MFNKFKTKRIVKLNTIRQEDSINEPIENNEILERRSIKKVNPFLRIFQLSILIFIII
jgi:hypothetical protein